MTHTIEFIPLISTPQLKEFFNILRVYFKFTAIDYFWCFSKLKIECIGVGWAMFRMFWLWRRLLFYNFIVERLSWLDISTENLRRWCNIWIAKLKFGFKARRETLYNWVRIIISFWRRLNNCS
jgi:hypothetical protein